MPFDGGRIRAIRVLVLPTKVGHTDYRIGPTNAFNPEVPTGAYDDVLA